MRKNICLLLLTFTLASCYTYQVKKPANISVETNQDAKKTLLAKAKTEKEETQSLDLPKTSVPVNIQEKLSANKNVRIDVDGKTYKIIVDRWEKDSLVAHPVHNSKQILKFHKNQINAEKIAEKRFSQPIADIITVVAYAGIGAGIWYLLQ